MNELVQNRQTPDPSEERLLDLLVDGELGDAERRSLLLRFENQPNGWRRCALAFLEAQSWRDAFRPVSASSAVGAKPEPMPRPVARKRPYLRSTASLAGLAASLVAAFTLGWGLHKMPADSARSVSIAAENKAATVEPVDPPLPQPLVVAVQEASPSQPDNATTPSDLIVRQWEQKGFRAETQTHLMSMELEDGQRVTVPIREVRLQYVGDRTY